MKYNWRILSTAGKETSGVIEAEDDKKAVQKLKLAHQDYYAIEVDSVPAEGLLAMAAARVASAAKPKRRPRAEPRF